MNGRNFMRLVQLVPGANEGAAELAGQRHAAGRSPPDVGDLDQRRAATTRTTS